MAHKRRDVSSRFLVSDIASLEPMCPTCFSLNRSQQFNRSFIAYCTNALDHRNARDLVKQTIIEGLANALVHLVSKIEPRQRDWQACADEMIGKPCCRLIPYCCADCSARLASIADVQRIGGPKLIPLEEVEVEEASAVAKTASVTPRQPSQKQSKTIARAGTLLAPLFRCARSVMSS